MSAVAPLATAHGAPRDFEEWRTLARGYLAAQLPPDAIAWSDREQPALLGAREPAAAVLGAAAADTVRVPAELVRLLQSVAMYRDPARWHLMYRLLWRTVHERHALLEDAADPDVRRAQEMAKAVGRDLHKMHAFVRFREVEGEDASQREDERGDGELRYVAWFEPEHLTLAAGARFFVKRFPNMRWTIATPDGAAVWDGRALQLLSSPARDSLPRGDALEGVWRTYYRSICNAARIRPAAMQREMPQKYWKNLPEAADIGRLLRDSPQRLAGFDDPEAPRERHAPIRATAASAPAARDDALEACRRCELWRHATQAIAGEGPADARLVLVGEQPGDEEDLRGRPFVGPAGRVLDEALREAGLDRSTLYVTNAVKHFKWEPRGKRRLHKTPGQREIAACQVWLLGELERLKPAAVVALGSTALKALTGEARSVERSRGEMLQGVDGSHLLATYHPSAVLRAPPGERERLRARLVEDLRRAAAFTARERAPSPANNG